MILTPYPNYFNSDSYVSTTVLYYAWVTCGLTRIFFVRFFSCVGPLIDHEFRHCNDNVMTNIIVNNRTDA